MDNPILDIAQETKTTLHNWSETQSVIDADGKMLEDSEARDWSERMWGVIASAFKYSDENSDNIPPEESLLDFFRASVEELFGGDSEQDGDVDGGLIQQRKMVDESQRLLWMAEFWGLIIGSPIDRQSLKFFWLEEGIDGGMHSVE